MTDPYESQQASPAAGILIGIAAAIGGAALGALAWGGIYYIFVTFTPMRLLGVEAMLCGALVGVAVALTSQGKHLVVRVIATLLALIAGVTGSVLGIWWNTGKPLSVLFSDQPFNGVPGPATEYDVTMNTLFSTLNLLVLIVCGAIAWYFSGRSLEGPPPLGYDDAPPTSQSPERRPAEPGPPCFACGYDLGDSIAQGHHHCPNCGAAIDRRID